MVEVDVVRPKVLWCKVTLVCTQNDGDERVDLSDVTVPLLHPRIRSLGRVVEKNQSSTIHTLLKRSGHV